MTVNREGKVEKMDRGLENELECPSCKCKFSFKERDVETTVDEVPYERGIKKILGFNKDYIVHKYITCPWCKSKMQLKYTVV